MWTYILRRLLRDDPHAFRRDGRLFAIMQLRRAIRSC